MVPFPSNPHFQPIEIDETTTPGKTYIRYVLNGPTNDDNSANCAIQCYDETGATTKVLWAGGNTSFIYAWGSRAGYTYEPLKK
jgi:hypothetical protein